MPGIVRIYPAPGSDLIASLIKDKLSGGKPYISLNSAIIKAKKRQRAPVPRCFGLVKLKAKMMNIMELMMTRDQRPSADITHRSFSPWLCSCWSAFSRLTVFGFF